MVVSPHRMTFIDTYSIGVWTMALVAPIAYMIGAVAFFGFVRRMSVMALLFSISFFLLFIPSLDFSLRHFYDYGLLDWVAIETVTVVAIVLLVLAYLFEIGRHRIVLSQLQSWVVLLSFALSLAYAVYQFMSWPDYTYYGLGVLLQYVLYYLPIGLIAIVITLMVSLHREKGNRITLVGMTGFILILSGWAIVGALLALGRLAYVETLTEGWMDPALQVANLLGYIIFLAAIVSARAIKH